MNLRKDHTSFSETPVPGAAPELYKVLPEKQKSVGTNQFMGSDKTYVMPNAGGAQTPAKPSQEQQQVKAQSSKDKKKGERIQVLRTFLAFSVSLSPFPCKLKDSLT